MPPACMPLPQFERLLLRGDAAALRAAGLHDAAAVAAGHVDAFLPVASPLLPPSASPHALPRHTPSLQLAHEVALQAATSVSIHSPLLSAALATALPRSPAADAATPPLMGAYVAGVALLNAFLRDNWAGPSAVTTSPTSPPPLPNDASPLYLALDAEDVARPAVSLYCLRAARHIMHDCLHVWQRAGATLAPWWAARALLAHQAVLAHPVPALHYAIFRHFRKLLGPDAAVLPDHHPPVADANHAMHAADDGDHHPDDCLLPTPITGPDDDMRDDDDDHHVHKPFAPVLNDRGVDGPLAVLAYLELAIAQRIFYDSDGARRSLRQAVQLSGIAISVSGELGVRTKHQTKQTAQLVARSFRLVRPHAHQYDTRPAAADAALSTLFPVQPTTPAHPVDAAPVPSLSPDFHPFHPRPEDLPMPKDVQVSDPDVLGYVKLSERPPPQSPNQHPGSDANGEDDNDDDHHLGELFDHADLADEIEFLTPLEQTLALAHASVIRASNASHILTKEEMAPYIDLVLRNAKSPHGSTSVVQICALLHRVSFERNRGRYLERCMAQMEEIAKYVDDPMEGRHVEVRARSAAERTALVLASSLPPRWELMKELAISFGRIGLVKSAMEIFEKLEMWEELVDCHRLMGNLGRAEELVRDHLDLLDAAVMGDGIVGVGDDAGFNPSHPVTNRAVQERAARRPRLLCVLGEVTRDPTLYEKAWTESGGRYARAKRALARLCVEREEWEAAVVHFKDALRVNPLFPDTWFTYGCAAINVGDMKLAANAFTTVVQLTPDNGEAWNNLARVLHELGKKKEALRALMEAGKLKRDSWRIWDNAVMIATELRSCLDIVRGMERLLELRGKDGVVSEAIGVAVAEVIRMSTSEDEEDTVLVGTCCRRLLQILGRCTALVSTNASVWAAYSELHEIVPGVEARQKAFDCRLKQVRSLVAYGDWKTEHSAFLQMAMACDAMSRVVMETESEPSVRAARMQLDSVMEQTVERFSGDEGFRRLRDARQRVGDDDSSQSQSTTA